MLRRQLRNARPITYASEFDHSGYAVAARRYIRALVAADVQLRWEPLGYSHQGRVPVSNKAARQSPLRDLFPRVASPPGHVAEATIAHCIPLSWDRLFAAFPARRNIGQTVWETESIPTRWHRELAPADELWVPTRWNADTMRRGGWTRPVHVVPHITDVAPAAPPPIELSPTATVFAAVGAWDTRKRPDLTLAAYLRAFTADDDVVLVVKTAPRVVAWHTTTPVEHKTWWQVAAQVMQHSHPPAVMLETATWTDGEVAGLVRRADAFVTLTATEGWGLGAFDAAAAGTPLVITGWGGQREWLADDAPFLVPSTMEPADHPDVSMFEPGMTWARADVDAAADLLREIHRDRTAARAASAALARRLQRDYSPAAIGAQMKELLA